MSVERRFGFPRSIRLRRSEDFRRVNRGGRFGTPHLVVRHRRRPGEGPRFGLAVSRKVGNAVVRNRVKRWLRESIRLERGDLTGVDVVFIARPGAATAGFATLRHEVATALTRVRSAYRRGR